MSATPEEAIDCLCQEVSKIGDAIIAALDRQTEAINYLAKTVDESSENGMGHAAARYTNRHGMPPAEERAQNHW